jgi:hypothetical protein
MFYIAAATSDCNSVVASSDPNGLEVVELCFFLFKIFMKYFDPQVAALGLLQEHDWALREEKNVEQSLPLASSFAGRPKNFSSYKRSEG